MKRLLRITVLFSVTLLWWGEKGYAATPAMDAAEKETVSATVEAEADKKDPKSDKKSDEPKRKRNLGHLSGSFDFEVSLNNGWDSQNCEFVIYVFKEEEDAAFIVNNGAVCPVGGKVDYKYESVE